MEKEHKDLVITDLCGRLPHKVIVEFISYKGEEKPWIGELSCKDLDCFIHDVGFLIGLRVSLPKFLAVLSPILYAA